MEDQSDFEVKEYLKGFDQILCEMSNKMLSFNTTSNITINFIECMIAHHEAAIYMCENLLTYTNYKPLYNISKDIIKIQTQGLAEMRKIVRTTITEANMPNHVASYENNYLIIIKNMVNKMKNRPRTQNINFDFTAQMILHHKGAIEMCNNLLQYPIDDRLKIVATSIIQEQTKGIEELRYIQEH